MFFADTQMNGVAVILMLLAAVGSIAAVIFMTRRHPKVMGWLLALGAGVGAIVLLAITQDTMSHSLLERERTVLMVNIAETLAAEAAHRQKELEAQTETYLREREAVVGDVLPLTDLARAEVKRPGLAWMPEVDEQFAARTFPSKHIAMRSLMRRVLPLFDTVVPEGERPTVIQLTSGAKIDDADVQRMFDDIGKLIREEFPDSRVLFDPSDHRAVVPDPPAVDGGVSLQFSLTDEPVIRSPLSPEREHRSEDFDSVQTLRASLKGFGGTSAGDSVRIINKPWVDEFDQFWSRRSGRYLVARTDTFADSATAAHQQAMGKAIQLLSPPIISALEQVTRQQGLPVATPSDIRISLRNHLEAGFIVTDRFSQELRAPYGRLWREAILLRVDEGELTVVIQQIAEQSRARHARQLSQGVAFCLLLAVLVVLYIFLNWATKGYYQGSIKLVLGLLGAAGTLTIVLSVTAWYAM